MKCKDCYFCRENEPSSDGKPHTCMGIIIDTPKGGAKYDYPGLTDKDLEKNAFCKNFYDRKNVEDAEMIEEDTQIWKEAQKFR